MPLVIGFVALLGAALLLTSAVADASFADVITGKAGQSYRTNAAAAATSTPASSPSSGIGGGMIPAIVSKSGYTNPLQHVTSWERTDQGVDAQLPVGSPIVAPGKIRIAGIIPDWFNGQPLVWWQLLDGPDAGKYQYVAEQITNLATPGTVLEAGQPIATYASSGTAIEFGWATATGATLAHATTGYIEGQVTSAGRSIRQWLNSVGANAGAS